MEEHHYTNRVYHPNSLDRKVTCQSGEEESLYRTPLLPLLSNTRSTGPSAKERRAGTLEVSDAVSDEAVNFADEYEDGGIQVSDYWAPQSLGPILPIPIVSPVWTVGVSHRQARPDQ